ncbi:vacuolar protein sorting-associated protein VTA1 homolog [Homarus americanus]|nr:vacuolar protein sorting-associated protein VTA1 homolog [Homarus americanus]XP_042207220.1 vacuolar protein sorting-associated protein VTA1 homolog [Homarus americanus]XP_042207228.1 vacuolar protein sorting-associated protein VTA1 homolog [Homarus americanus]
MSAARPNLPPCPPSLRTVQHYIRLATEYDKREPVVAYWSRLYALQTALRLDRKSPEARAVLTGLMDYLETFKKEHADNESVTNDIAGQALVENVGHKLFMWADGEDRAARFNKNVVKVFYTAGLLFDVCEVFGEISEEVASQRKYAKWKATYIHNCLKNGETPIPGPMGGDDEGLGEEDGGGEGDQEGAVGGSSGVAMGWSHPSQPHPGLPSVPGSTDYSGLPSVSSSSPPPPAAGPPAMMGSNNFSDPLSQPQVPHSLPAQPPPTNVYHSPAPPTTGGSVTLSPDMIGKAQKYCKWAISALDYEDSKTAINNLQKALTLLTTGRDS